MKSTISYKNLLVQKALVVKNTLLGAEQIYIAAIGMHPGADNLELTLATTSSKVVLESSSQS